MLGLALGDAIGATVPADGPLLATSAGQLACFTVEGIVRASVRYGHKGICHPPSVIWHAFHRWAAMQGIAGIKSWQVHADGPWPDGWLSHVPALATRRGSAPATVTAIQSGRQGSLDKPSTPSIGAHALTRSLPAGCLGRPGGAAAEIAALTHAPAAAGAAAVGATIVANLGRGHEIVDAVQSSERDCRAYLQQAAESPITSALVANRERPKQVDVLADLVPKATAPAVLAGAVYVAIGFHEPEQIRDALLFAASVPHGQHIAAAVGSFLGTAHGVDALPVDWVSRLELAWVADTLARDMISEFTDSPSGSEYSEAPDPHWWDRYPGW
jgi:ADP-ribosylglycohydrolase